MNARVVDDARPASGWSAPAFDIQAARLQSRYAAYDGRLKFRQLRTMLSRVTNYLYSSQQSLTDGYFPLGIFFLKVRGGKVAIVFPKCNDDSLHDGVNTDCGVSIHVMGAVHESDVAALCDEILAHVPEPAPVEAEPDDDADDDRPVVHGTA